MLISNISMEKFMKTFIKNNRITQDWKIYVHNNKKCGFQDNYL